MSTEIGAKNPLALGDLTGDLFYASSKSGYVKKDFGAIRTLDLKNALEGTEIMSMNRKTIVTFASSDYEVSAEILEIRSTELRNDILPGIVTTVAGTPTVITTELLGTGWTLDTPIKIANKNGDNTIVTAIVVDADGTPLILGTDYSVYVSNGTNGDLGYTYIVPLTAQAGVLDVDYSYTPNASTKYTDDTSIDGRQMPDLKIWIESIDSNGKMQKWYYSSAFFSGEFLDSLRDVSEDKALEGSTLTFKMSKGGTFEYEDERNV